MNIDPKFEKDLEDWIYSEKCLKIMKRMIWLLDHLDDEESKQWVAKGREYIPYIESVIAQRKAGTP